MRILKFIIANIGPYKKYVVGIFLAMCLITVDNTFKPLLVKQFTDIVSNHEQGSLWVIFAVYALLQFMLVSNLPCSLSGAGARVILAARRIDKLEALSNELNNKLRYPNECIG